MNATITRAVMNILAVAVGAVIAGLVVMLVQSIGHQVYGAVSEADMQDPEAMAELVASMPAGALWFVVASYAAGSFVGGLVAAFIGRSVQLRLALMVGVLFLIAGIMNLVAIPHPLWFSIVSLLVFLPAAWLGGRIGAGRGTAGRTPAPE